MIQGAIENSFANTTSSSIAAEGELLKGTSLEGNKSAQTLLGIANTRANNGTDEVNPFLEGLDTTISNLGIATLGWTRDLSTINKDDYKLFMNKIGMRTV